MFDKYINPIEYVNHFNFFIYVQKIPLNKMSGIFIYI